MKNYKLNLIKGLWDDSHEKQKPQRFARYAAMLIMLLTLGVGQMWATDFTKGSTIYLDISGVGDGSNNWTSSSATICAIFYYSDNTSWCYETNSAYTPKNTLSSSTTVSAVVSGSIYKVTVPNATVKMMYFIRKSGTSVWNYSAKMSADDMGQNNCVTLSDWDNNSSWTKYAPEPAIIGSMNSWSPTANTFSGTSGSVTCSISLSANTVYEFKVITGTTYYGYGSTTGDLTYVGQSGSTTLASDGQNIRLATAGAGTYVFTWHCTSHTLSVAYPTVTHPSSDYVYFKNTGNWANVKAHVFTGDDAVDVWPGPQISSFNFDGTNYYYAALGGKTSIIFSMSGTPATKTGDLTTASSNKGKYYDYSSSTWKNFTATLTLNHQSPTNTPAPNSITVTYGASTNLTGDVITTSPTKTGYTFGGYYTSAAGGGSQLIGTNENVVASVSNYTDGSKKWIRTGSSVSTTLYAKWTQTLNLNSNGATNDGTTSVTATFNGGIGSIATAPTKTGYTFGGWYPNSDGTGVQVINASKALQASKTDWTDSNTKWIHAGASTLYAKWTQTVTLNANTSYGGSTNGSAAVIFNGAKTSYTAATPSSGSYALKGYFTNTTGGTQVIDKDGNLIANITNWTDASGNWIHAGSSTLYAQWKTTYTLHYEGNGNTGGTAPDDEEWTMNTTATVAGNTGSLVKTNYSFGGWNTAPEGNGTNYAAGSGTFTISANTNLYAKWNEVMRDITIVGGTTSSTTAGVVTTGSATAAAPAAGKKFTGWNIGAGVTLTGCVATDRTITFTATADATVTAQYADRAQVKMYFAKPTTLSWGTLYAYAWQNSNTSNKNATYPGIEISTTETINHVVYYVYQYYTEGDGIGGSATGQSTWDRVIFGCNNDSKKTGDLTISNGHYYFKSSTGTGKTAALTSAWCIKGEWNSWSEDADQITHTAAATGSKSITLTTSNKEFKIYNIVNETWWRFSGNVTATKAATTIANNIDGNMTITPSVAGPYTFALASLTGTPTLAITYPTTYTVTFNAETFVNGGASHSTSTTGGTLSAVDGNSAALSSGGLVISGGTAVITASKKTGYSFIGFYTTAACTTPISGAGVSISDNVLTLSSISGNKTVYAKFSENMTTVNLVASPTGKGTFTKGGAAVTSVSAGVTTKPSVTAVPGTGYHLTGTVWTKNNSNITLSSTTAATTVITGCGTDGTSSNLTATFTPNTYAVSFSANSGTGDAMTNQNFTYDVAQDLSENTYTKTGYNFDGWATSAGGSKVYDDEESVSNLTATNNATFPLFAHWAPKSCDVDFDFDESDDGYGSKTGATTSTTATYDAAMTSVTPPTAAQGYAFMGYFTAADGEGTQYYDASGNSAATWAVNTEDDVTLYAYYKKAEVTGITFSPAAIVATNATVTATPTISPTPTVTTAVCWELQYSNGTRVPSQPTFTPGGGNAVSFTAPSTSATYRLQAVLHLDDCNGDELSVYSETFQVAGEHTVTVRYQDSDGRTIKASTEITGRPLTWTTAGDITPPTITGYTFARWDAGDGVTIKNGDSDPVTTTTTSSIQIKAVYDGTLTAVYTKKRMIYFYNTLNWGSVYVYFYKNDSYWQTVSPYKGSGSKTTSTWTDTPYSEGLHGQMLPVSEGSNIYYFDAEAESVPSSYDDVVFTEHDQHNYEFFWKTNAVRRGDYKTTMPMFVPLADQTADVHNETNYYNSGYWMNYPENSGYTLKIYNAYDATKETAAVQSIAFPYSEDLKMPLKLDVELSDGYNHNYWFMVYRNDGTYMGGIYTFKQGYQDEQVISGSNNKNQITTSAPGNYTFTLTYHDNGSGTNNYYIDVDFPIATGDYRIVYKDNAAWSHGTHEASWCHPSHSIGKATDAKKDTVSFFISKAVGITPSMKFQKASVDNEGVVTWADVAGGSITIPSSVTTTGVYNFIVSQPAGGASISLEKVEPYTGNFYIRTDCAGNTKWDSFKNVDHQMTYSDYAEDNSGYSHYFVHWVENGNNVKFTIANDYSMCISDTLTQDYGTVVANIDANGFLASGSAHNANIRFMWNQATNKISRAYISGSSNVADRFLVLEGDERMYDESGNVLTDAGGGKISGLNDYEINLVDDQNFVYERTIQVKTTARAKLTAKYNNNVQYFKGSSGDFAEGTTIQLLGGEASDTKHTMRIVYDFKTNRLVTAYMPSGTIESDLAINADLMIVREHQNAGQQLLFNGGSLSDVHTVYGVMRFNKWTLNNKETTGGHSIVGDPKSAYERSVFWISFPFDVKLSDVFGFGTYGVDWIIEYYDGTARAAEGYWADSKGFWKYVMPSQRSTYELKAGKGYALVLDLARMKDDNEDFWPNSIEQVELFFPSTGNVGGIEATNVTTTAESHLYDAAAHPGHADDRTYKDSHWNMIGVPSYANYGTTLTSDGSTTITWSTPVETDLPYLYEWNAVDNTYTAQTGSTYPFKSMHSYMVQYHGSLYWSLASATPVTPIVARRTYAEKPQNVELRLELSQNEKMIDQTFVKLSNDEEVSAAFKFDEDLSKEMNKNKANIYTMIADLSVAGNTMPMSEQTTVVPVGVKIAADGDYTFAIPDGTEGVGVTLVDTETGVRTSLSALDYTVNLSAGTYENRFVLEISPIKQTPTGIENSEVSHQHSDTCKVLIDGILYIVKDGKMFDARGAVVK